MPYPRIDAARLGLLALALASGPFVPLSDRGPSIPAQGPRARATPDEPPAGLTRDDWGQIKGAVRASSYHAARVVKPGEAPASVAANHAQGYGTTFRPAGIEIRSHGRPGQPWRLGLTVTGYGYASDVRPLAPVEPVTEKERVEYRRGPVIEWYVNRSGGLEQGFELGEPEPRSREPLVVEMSVSGDLEVRADGDAASFPDRSGVTRLRYVGLKAWDADARPVTSRMEASNGSLRLVLEGAGARFPVTVDPTFVRTVEFFGHSDAVNQTVVSFGNAVSVSGDTLVVGAPEEDTTNGFNAGAAYVFVRSGTAWAQQARLVASDGARFDSFGHAVSVFGDTLVVGASGKGGVGAAYVFARSGTTWTQQVRLKAPDGTGYSSFGAAVSVSASTAVIGAPNAELGGSVVGAAYVFVRSGTAWVRQAELTASDAAANSYFGGSVSVSDDTAVIGALGTVGAYVFVRSGWTWTEQQKLVAPGGRSFGASVSTFGDTAVIGLVSVSGVGGAAHVFVRSGTTWTKQAQLTPPDPTKYGYFGFCVSLSGDVAVVGEPYAAAFVGAAHVFVRSGTTWTEQAQLTPLGPAEYDNFGSSVSVSGDTIASGAPGDRGWAGSVYAFVPSSVAWTQQAKLIAPAADVTGGDNFGAAVSISGDTVVVGAPNDFTAAGYEAGSAYVFMRSGATWSEQKLTASDATYSDRFGSSVSVSGDTMVVGAPDFDGPGHGAGGAYAFVRSGTSWTEQQKLGDSWTVLYGAAVSVSGDTAVVGGPPRVTYYDTGAVNVYVRSGTTWSLQRSFVASEGATYDRFGTSVSISGDTLAVGDPLEGPTYVFVRSGTTWTEQARLRPSDGSDYDWFGGSVSLDGDTLLVGAPYSSVGGAVYVFQRSGTTWSEQQRLTAPQGALYDSFGASVSVSAGVALVGAPGASGAGAYVFARSGTGWVERQGLHPSDRTPYDRFGAAVAVSADTVVVGARNRDTADGVYAGSAYVFGEVFAGADLSITVTDGHKESAPGQSVTYTVTVENAGPEAAAGAAVTDIFPAALTCSTTCAGTGGSTCTPGPFAGNINDTVSIAPGQSVTYTAACTISLSATGTLTNTARVTPPPTLADPDPGNNSSTDTDTLTPSADLAVLVTHAPDPVAPGGALSYAVQVTNRGPSISTGMILTDVLPTGVTFVSSTPGSGVCDLGGSTLVCSFGALSPGASHAVSLEVTVNAGARGVLRNTTSVAGNEADPVGANDSDTETTLVSMPTQFFTVAPCRVVDTRGGAEVPVGGPALAARSARTFALAGHCGIPSTAQAVALNVTVTQPGAPGNLRLFPAGLTLPLVSSVNYAAGQTRASNVVVALDASGGIAAYADQASGTTVHIIVDVSGYFE